MRKFSSYGPINTDLHYHAPRKALIDTAYTKLIGDTKAEDGNDITVWAPRQSGKTWVMQQVLFGLLDDEQFDVVKLDLQHLELETDVDYIAADISRKLLDALNKPPKKITKLGEFEETFTNDVLDKPLILLLDEFDSLSQDAISGLVRILRNIYSRRLKYA